MKSTAYFLTLLLILQQCQICFSEVDRSPCVSAKKEIERLNGKPLRKRKKRNNEQTKNEETTNEETKNEETSEDEKLTDIKKKLKKLAKEQQEEDDRLARENSWATFLSKPFYPKNIAKGFTQPFTWGENMNPKTIHTLGEGYRKMAAMRNHIKGKMNETKDIVNTKESEANNFKTNVVQKVKNLKRELSNIKATNLDNFNAIKKKIEGFAFHAAYSVPTFEDMDTDDKQQILSQWSFAVSEIKELESIAEQIDDFQGPLQYYYDAVYRKESELTTFTEELLISFANHRDTILAYLKEDTEEIDGVTRKWIEMDSSRPGQWTLKKQVGDVVQNMGSSVVGSATDSLGKLFTGDFKGIGSTWSNLPNELNDSIKDANFDFAKDDVENRADLYLFMFDMDIDDFRKVITTSLDNKYSEDSFNEDIEKLKNKIEKAWETVIEGAWALYKDARFMTQQMHGMQDSHGRKLVDANLFKDHLLLTSPQQESLAIFWFNTSETELPETIDDILKSCDEEHEGITCRNIYMEGFLTLEVSGSMVNIFDMMEKLNQSGFTSAGFIPDFTYLIQDNFGDYTDKDEPPFKFPEAVSSQLEGTLWVLAITFGTIIASIIICGTTVYMYRTFDCCCARCKLPKIVHPTML